MIMSLLAVSVLKASTSDRIERTDQKIAILISIVGFVFMGQYLLSEGIELYATAVFDTKYQ
jgi:hypothetical protein